MPIFLALTGGRSRRARRRAAWQAVRDAFGVICAFAAFGQQILDCLGIGNSTLRGTGGLLLLLVALELPTDRAEAPRQVEDVKHLAGAAGDAPAGWPGAIVAAIVFARRADGAAGEVLGLAAVIVAAPVVLWLMLRFAGVIIRVIKESGIVLVADSVTGSSTAPTSQRRVLSAPVVRLAW